MAKYDWGFEIINKAEAEEKGEVVSIVCTKTHKTANFALRNHRGGNWGDLLDHDMSAKRVRDAEIALSTWGWI